MPDVMELVAGSPAGPARPRRSTLRRESSERLNDPRIPLNAFFSVAGFARPLDLDFAEKINHFVSGPEFELKFELENLQKHCKNFYILESTNDPYIPLSCGDFMTKKLNAHRYTFQNRDHLGTWDGSDGKFEELLKLILEPGLEV